MKNSKDVNGLIFIRISMGIWMTINKMIINDEQQY